MKTIELVVYKQGGNWMCNKNGYVKSLPYWVRTKKDVREYLVNGNENPECIIRVVFA